VEFGTPVERRGAEINTSGVNRVACLVIMETVKVGEEYSGSRRRGSSKVNIVASIERRRIKNLCVLLTHSSYKRSR
jgi:hypothetical protein